MHVDKHIVLAQVMPAVDRPYMVAKQRHHADGEYQYKLYTNRYETQKEAHVKAVSLDQGKE